MGATEAKKKIHPFGRDGDNHMVVIIKRRRVYCPRPSAPITVKYSGAAVTMNDVNGDTADMLPRPYQRGIPNRRLRERLFAISGENINGGRIIRMM